MKKNFNKLDDYHIDYATLPASVDFFEPIALRYQLIVTANGKEIYNAITDSSLDLEDVLVVEAQNVTEELTSADLR